MTKIIVNPGNCGFSVSITAEKGAGKKVCISLETDCEMLMKMSPDIAELDMQSLFMNHISNPVYRSAALHLKHVACPVPCAILKAAEVEMGLCVPEDVKMKFNKDS